MPERSWRIRLGSGVKRVTSFVEAQQEVLVSRRGCLQELLDGRVRRSHALAHAAAGVHQEADGSRAILLEEAQDSLLDIVLEDAKCVCTKSSNRPVPGVGHGNRDEDLVDIHPQAGAGVPPGGAGVARGNRDLSFRDGDLFGRERGRGGQEGNTSSGEHAEGTSTRDSPGSLIPERTRHCGTWHTTPAY